MAQNVRFIKTTKAKWLSKDTYDPAALYFCEDTRELFKGKLLFTDGIRTVTSYEDLPQFNAAADGILYYTSDTKNGYLLNDTRDEWIQVIYSPVTDLSSVATEDMHKSIPTVGAVKEALASISGTGGSVPIASNEIAGKVKASTEVQVKSDGTMSIGMIAQDKIENLAETFATKEELDSAVANVGGEVYQVTSDSTDIAELSKDITGKVGDVLIVTNSNGVKSAYHYDKENGWIACDGNVDASTVILKDNITMAGNYTQVGNLSKSSTGTATFATAGKSVADVLSEIFSKRLQPSITSTPTVSLTFNQAKAYEVGTKVTPSYSASLSAGSYTYGPATGIKATSWKISDTNGNSATTASGSFDELTVADDTNYKITATATYDDGAIAVDNLSDASNPVVKIAGGTQTKTSGAITGYRSFFYGVLSSSTTDAPLTSQIVRGLTNGGAYNGSKTFTVNANASAKRIVIAIPSASTRGGLKEVILTSAMNTPVTDSYPKTVKAVKVEGVDGATAVDYDIYMYEPATIDAGEVHKITLA